MQNLEGHFRRATRDVAEAVLEAENAGAAWTRIMALLQEAIGFDSGLVGATPGSTAEGQAAILGHDETELRRGLGRYLSQIEASEITLYFERAQRVADVFPKRRREEMAACSVPRELGFAEHALCRVSLYRGQVVGINLERRRPGHAFDDRSLEFVDTVWPLLRVVSCVHAPSANRPDVAAAWALTRREAEVAHLVLRGLQNAEVAGVLGLSRSNVRNGLARIFEKAGASTRSELVFLAHQLSGSVSSQSLPAPADDGLLAFSTAVRSVAAARRTSEPPQPATSSDTRAAPYYSAPRAR
jgi:DNA-binding CsgD family transcriptional regulator